MALALSVVTPTLGFGAQVPDAERYVVGFSAGHFSEGRAAVRALGGIEKLRLGPQNAMAAHLSATALAALRTNPHVLYIEPDVIRAPQATTAGETTPYGISMVQADLVSSPNPGNRTVCIIDSGYSIGHEDLQDAGVTGSDDPTGSGHWQNDSCGHGSHVAGTISAIGGNGVGVVGVTPGVTLHIVKVFGDDVADSGTCTWTYSSSLVAALNTCVAYGANVVSMSLGGGARSHTEEVAFQNAWNNGVLSVAAAGNGGNKRMSFPASYSSVMSVAAIDSNKLVASFSQQNRQVDIAAPGVGVLSTVPWLENDTLTANGTTWSGGHIEGAARTNGTSGVLAAGLLCDTAPTPGQWAGKVVICERGGVTFAAKVQNVQAGGGVAAAIYNNAANGCGDFAGTLGTGVTSPIPAISMNCADGQAALGQVNQFGTVVSQITYGASGYEAWAGTSMATPHVSGVAALVWSCNPGKTNAEIRSALEGTAEDLGAAGPDSVYGHGLVRAKQALLALGTGTCTVK